MIRILLTTVVITTNHKIRKQKKMILDSIENQAILDPQKLLKSFASGDELLGDLTTAFSSKYD